MISNTDINRKNRERGWRKWRWRSIRNRKVKVSKPRRFRICFRSIHEGMQKNF